MTSLYLCTQSALEAAEKTSMQALYDGTSLGAYVAAAIGGVGFGLMGLGLRDVIREARTPQSAAYEEAKHASYQAKGKPE